MVIQIPREKLADYLLLFREHKHYRNILEAIPIHSTGKGFVDNLEIPGIILFSIGDEEGECFLAGNHESSRIKDILALIPERKAIIVPSKQWLPVLKNYWKYVGFYPRTDFSAEDLSLEHVQRLIKPLPEGFELVKLDSEIVKQLEHYKRYPGGPEAFIKEGGIGFIVKKGDKVVCRIATLPSVNYEIDVATSPEYRRKGLATVVCAKFLEYCLEQGIKPHWSAANERSVKLALKLGFTAPETYKCYYWRSDPLPLQDIKNILDNKYRTGLEEKKQFRSSLEFEEILSVIDRLIQLDFVKPDEPYIKDLVKKTREHIKNPVDSE
ncbi:MAG: GNAT family N-acetyltransferase [Candidatus Odinarchaeota archaeon]